MSVDDPLFIKITTDLKVGEKVSVEDAIIRWEYSDGHTRRVINWMADQQQPPTMQKLSNAHPFQWKRI